MSIGGKLDLNALAMLHDRDRHRPQTHDEMRVAVHELAGRGMSIRDRARNGLIVEQVRRMLGGVL